MNKKHDRPMIIALILVSWVGLAATDALGERVRLRQEHPSQPFLRQDGPQYRNYALRYYDNCPNHTFPYVEKPKVYYNHMGDYLLNGYDVWDRLHRVRPGVLDR